MVSAHKPLSFCFIERRDKLRVVHHDEGIHRGGTGADIEEVHTAFGISMSQYPVPRHPCVRILFAEKASPDPVPRPLAGKIEGYGKDVVLEHNLDASP